MLRYSQTNWEQINDLWLLQGSILSRLPSEGAWGRVLELRTKVFLAEPSLPAMQGMQICYWEKPRLQPYDLQVWISVLLCLRRDMESRTLMLEGWVGLGWSWSVRSLRRRSLLSSLWAYFLPSAAFHSEAADKVNSILPIYPDDPDKRTNSKHSGDSAFRIRFDNSWNILLYIQISMLAERIFLLSRDSILAYDYDSGYKARVWTHFLPSCTPADLERLANGRLYVTYHLLLLILIDYTVLSFGT